MREKEKQPDSGREATDKSLDLERTRTDAELLDLLAAERAHGTHVRQERPSSAHRLSSERAAHTVALDALLHLERDETDRHLLREREQADDVVAARDDVLGMVSHDLRNMLSNVALSAASLRDISSTPEVEATIARHAARIQRSTARMNRLIGDLLDVVSIEAGHFAVVKAPHDTNDLLRETLEIYQPVAAAKSLTLTTQVDGALPSASYDYDRILQVLANLVGNAIKFSVAAAEIVIAARSTKENVELSVIDTGIGIAPERLEVVFERFWQAATGHRAGLGLGLYISRCIVEAHGGRMWATSRLDEGSTFSFTLPLG